MILASKILEGKGMVAGKEMIINNGVDYEKICVILFRYNPVAVWV